MEFYISVLIFIVCMIALALLIYYFQERRNPKFSFNENQRAITSIALSLCIPEATLDKNKSLIVNQSSDIPVEIIRAYQKQQHGVEQYLPQPPRSGYTKNGIPFLDETSDSDTSNSEKIYFPQGTAAYSYARKTSMSAAHVRSINPRFTTNHINQNNPVLEKKIEVIDNSEKSMADAEKDKENISNDTIFMDTVKYVKSTESSDTIPQYSSNFLPDKNVQSGSL